MSEQPSLEIEFAGQRFTIGPLTCGQLEDLHVGTIIPESSDGAETIRLMWRRNYNILAVAFSEGYPNMTADLIRKMKGGTLQNVTGAVNEILQFSGIFKKKEDAKPEAAPGEAQAAA